VFFTNGSWDILTSQNDQLSIKPSLFTVWCAIIILHLWRWHGIVCYKKWIARYLPIPHLQPYIYDVHVHCIHDHIQILYTWFAQFWTQDLMESSQCLCHQTTTPFVAKVCVTFSFIFLTMKSLKNPKVDNFFFQMLVKWSKSKHNQEFYSIFYSKNQYILYSCSKKDSEKCKLWFF
jgi:hypothetical protein